MKILSPLAYGYYPLSLDDWLMGARAGQRLCPWVGAWVAHLCFAYVDGAVDEFYDGVEIVLPARRWHIAACQDLKAPAELAHLHILVFPIETN